MNKHVVNTDERPMTVRLSAKAWVGLFSVQIAFCVSAVWAASAWKHGVETAITDNTREIDRQGEAIKALAAALEKVSENSNKTAGTLERVLGRLERGGTP